MESSKYSLVRSLAVTLYTPIRNNLSSGYEKESEQSTSVYRVSKTDTNSGPRTNVETHGTIHVRGKQNVVLIVIVIIGNQVFG
jgi:hypothetical protein